MDSLKDQLRHFNQKNAKLMFIAVIFLLATHYYQANIGGSGLYIPFNLLVWCFISLHIAYSFIRIKNGQPFLISPLSQALLLSFLLLCVPWFYQVTEHADFALPRLLALAGLIAFYSSLLQLRLTASHKQLLVKLMIAACIMQTLFSLSQVFLLPHISFTWYLPPERPSGIFQQPNVAASFYATGLILLLIGLTRRAPVMSVNSKRLSQLFILTTGFLLACLISRTAWLALIISLPLLYLINYKQNVSNKTLLTCCIALAVGMVIGFIWLGSQPVLDNLINQKMQDVGARKVDFYYIIKMITANFWSGVGYGNFEAGLRNFFAEQWALGDQFGQVSPALEHPHNETLFWLAEGGAIVLVALLLIIVSVVKQLNWHNSHWLLACLPILIHSQLEYPWYHSITHALIVLILLYLFETEKTSKLNEFQCPSALFKIPALVQCLLVVPFMLSGLHSHYLFMDYKLSHNKDLQVFSKLINPVVIMQPYYFEVLTLRAQRGLAKGDLSELHAYEQWAEQQIPRTPRHALIKNQLKIKQILNKTQAYQQLKQQYQRWYPTTKMTQ